MQEGTSPTGSIERSIGDVRYHVCAACDVIGNAVEGVLIDKLTAMLERAGSLGTRSSDTAADAAGRLDGGNRTQRRGAQPYLAVAIAAGAGPSIGWMMRRR